MFRAKFSPIIRSTWLYLQHLVVFPQVVAGWCHGWATHPRHQPAATWVNTIRYCKYRQVLLMMGENIARNMSNSSKTPAGINSGEQCQILWIQASAPDDGRKHRPKHEHLIQDTSRHQLGWTVPDTVNTGKFSWWWAKTSPETWATQPRHQPAATWVNTTRYCKYRQVLLMMGENIPRKMSNSSKTPAGSNLGEHYQILWIQASAPDDGRKHPPKHEQLVQNTSRQQLGWTLPDTVNTGKFSWWWAKTSPETWATHPKH